MFDVKVDVPSRPRHCGQLGGDRRGKEDHEREETVVETSEEPETANGKHLF